MRINHKIYPNVLRDRNITEKVANPPLLEWGNLCLEPVLRSKKANLGRNQNIESVWVPVEKNVLGLVKEYSYPEGIGVFVHPGDQYYKCNRGIIERLLDAQHDTRAKPFFDFMFHEVSN